MEEASELYALRSRLVTSALAERRRIERALHDGVQQDLIAISVRLQLVRELVTTAPADALTLLDDVQQGARDALDRLRTLASEIYPSILDARGLPDALRAAARASPGTARVEAVGLGRYPAEIEAAVYFACRAVLDSLEPGAAAAIGVREEGGCLHLGIAGGRAVDLAGMRDLVEGVGADVTVGSTAGGDGRAEATFPLA